MHTDHPDVTAADRIEKGIAQRLDAATAARCRYCGLPYGVGKAVLQEKRRVMMLVHLTPMQEHVRQKNSNHHENPTEKQQTEDHRH